MDSEIEFGEIEEIHPEIQTPPDRNRHFAVVPCQNPAEGELRIFVDLDVMREMESHAASDTRVELGGVLLGGQYEDQDGQPFVVVSDSLRAEHYEATKGSFKFTHETWEQISRQREEFPSDLQMVGWYHTHPDWGVFLSGMDLFICDHFFNRPLDLALVIDPCRLDRGWFQWTNHEDQPRRTGGFYLVASRFRENELQQYAQELQGEVPMRLNPPTSPIAGQIQPATNYVPPPVARGPWLEFGVLGLLAMQFLMMCFLFWQAMWWSQSVGNQKSEAQTVQMTQQLGDLERARAAELTVEVQREMLRDFVLASGGDIQLAQKLEELEVENRRSRISLQAQNYFNGELTAENKRLQADSKLLEERLLEQKERVSESQAEVKRMQLELRQQTQSDSIGDTQSRASYAWYRDWFYLVVMAGIGLLGAMVGAASVTYLRREASLEMTQADEHLSDDSDAEVVYSKGAEDEPPATS